MNWYQAVATLVSAVGMALFYFLMEVNPKSPRKLATEGREFRMPDMRFHYSPEALYSLMDQAGETGRPRMRRYWLLDFGLIASFWGVMISVGLNVDGKNSALFIPMGITASARAVFDILENLSLLRLLRVYPTQKKRLATAAGLMTSVKFVCLYAWVSMLFFKLFLSAFNIVK